MRKLTILLLFILLLTSCTPAPPVETTAPTTEPVAESTTATDTTTAPTEMDWEEYYLTYAVDTGDREEMKRLMDSYLKGRLAYLKDGTEPESWEGTENLLYDWRTNGDMAQYLKTYREGLEELGIRVIDSVFWAPSNEGTTGAYAYHAFCVMETLTYEQNGEVSTIDIHHGFILCCYDVPHTPFVMVDSFVCPFTGNAFGLDYDNCEKRMQDLHALYPEPQPVPVEP